MGGGFPDERLVSRAEILYERIVATGSVVLKRIGGNRAGEIAAHRFLDNVEVQAILDTLSRRTLETCKNRRVLSVQDTTEINFSGRDGKCKDLGVAARDHSVGFFIHPQIAVDADSGKVLGLVNASIWTRGEKSGTPTRKIPYEDKESVCWLRGMESDRIRLAGAREVITVGDRGSDMYTLFAARPKGSDLVIRASSNRRLSTGDTLFDRARTMPVMGQYDLDIAAKPGRKARTARMTLRGGTVTLNKPGDVKEPEIADRLTLNFVETIELDPPGKTRPVVWRLYTTLPIDSPGEMQEIVRIYALRWRIEEIFRALKGNGLALEKTQVQAAHRLFKLAALAIAAATRIVQLVDARDGSDQPASDVIDPDLYDAVEAIGKTLEGKTGRQKNPYKKGNLAWLAWVAARLGGWNCYYKPPGPKTMATGWKQLATMLSGFIIAKEMKDV